MWLHADIFIEKFLLILPSEITTHDTILIFDKVPSHIDYEIRSKRTPELVKGRIEFNS